MLYIAILLSTLFVPGYFLSALVGIREYRFLSSITLSYALFIGMFVIARSNSWVVSEFNFAYLALVSGILFVTLIIRRRTLLRDLMSSTTMVSPSFPGFLLFLIVISVSTYHWFFGVYDEIPSDLYQHLAYARNAVEKIQENGFYGDPRYIHTILGEIRVWYILLAWSAIAAGSSVSATFEITMLVCPIIFLVGIACCADRLFLRFSFSYKAHQFAIFLAAFFVFCQMGINVFSFVRYYAYAPTMINFIVYFTGLICLLNLFENNGNIVRNLILIVVSMGVGLVVHTQEGLFGIVAGALLAIWWASARLVRVFRYESSDISQIILPSIALVMVLSIFASIMIWLRIETNLMPVNDNRVIPLPFTLPLFGQLFILDPTYQFFRVVTIWGVLVYGLFFVFIRNFKRQPFLVVGMLSPLVTVFNPLFTDIFLHLEKPTTLWRLSYFIPLHFVAAATVVFLFENLKIGGLVLRYISLTGIGCLFMFLLPSLFIPINTYGKITLGKVAEQNSWHHWQDLIEFLSENPSDQLGVKNRVLVDPVTAYAMEALTSYKADNFKFLPNPAYYFNTFVFDDYSEYPLEKYSNKLIIVNTRNGNLSESGMISGHWHQRVLSVSEYYPPQLIEHLESNPDKFQALWSNHGITIYKIR